MEQRNKLADLGEQLMLKTRFTPVILLAGALLVLTSGCGHGRTSQDALRVHETASTQAKPAADCDPGGKAAVYATSLGTVTSTVASYDSSAAAVAHWLANRMGVSGTHYSQEAPSTHVAVCVYDGSFSPDLPTPPGASPEQSTRIVVIVDNGVPSLLQSGTSADVSTSGPQTQ